MLLAMGTGEKFSSGGITFTVGMIITFTVIISLIVLMYLLKSFLNKYFIYLEKRQNKEVNKVEEDLSSKTPIQNEIIKEEVVVDSKTLDAVNSAVKLFMAQNNATPHEHYIIKTIKKINKGA